MRKILSILLALVFVFSFGIMAFAGNGDGTGGGNGDGTGGGNQNGYDATVNGPGTLTFSCMAGSNVYDIDSVSIPFNINSYPTGGLKHIDGGNLGQTINASTVVLTCNGSVVSGFSPVLSNVYCNGDKHNGYFNININSSLLKAGSSYTLTIKAGASWENQPKNHAVLNSDYSYSFSVAADAAPVETTTAESKQNSPLTTKSSSGKSSSKDTTKAASGSGSGKAAEANGETTTKEDTKADESTTAIETDESTTAAIETDESTTAAAGVTTTEAAKSADKTSPESAADGEVVNDNSKNAVIAAAVTVCILPMGAYALWKNPFWKKH